MKSLLIIIFLFIVTTLTAQNNIIYDYYEVDGMIFQLNNDVYYNLYLQYDKINENIKINDIYCGDNIKMICVPNHCKKFISNKTIQKFKKKLLGKQKKPTVK